MEGTSNPEEIIRFWETYLIGIKPNRDGAGYSRKTILKRISKLEKELGIIIVRPDKTNSQTHHLSVNYENELSSLIVDLDSFKHCYFNLMNEINAFLNDRRIIFGGFLGLRENYWLVNAVLTPLKLVLNLYNIFDLFLPQKDILDSESLHRKFVIIRSTINEVQIELHNSIFKEPLTSCDNYFTKTFLYDNLNLSNNILSGAMRGVNHKDIESTLIAFDKYGLVESAKTLLDSVWRLIYPVFYTIYPRCDNVARDELKDWRTALRNFSENDTTTQGCKCLPDIFL